MAATVGSLRKRIERAGVRERLHHRLGHRGPGEEVLYAREGPLRARHEDRTDLRVRDPVYVLERQPDAVLPSPDLLGGYVRAERSLLEPPRPPHLLGGYARAERSLLEPPRPPHLLRCVLLLAHVRVQRQDRDAVAARVVQER